MPEPSFKPALSAQKTLFGQVRPDILDPVKKALGLRAFVPGLSCLEFAQNFLLPRRQLAGRFNLNLDHQVTHAAPLQNRHASATLAQLLA